MRRSPGSTKPYNDRVTKTQKLNKATTVRRGGIRL